MSDLVALLRAFFTLGSGDKGGEAFIAYLLPLKTVTSLIAGIAICLPRQLDDLFLCHACPHS